MTRSRSTYKQLRSTYDHSTFEKNIQFTVEPKKTQLDGDEPESQTKERGRKRRKGKNQNVGPPKRPQSKARSRSKSPGPKPPPKQGPKQGTPKDFGVKGDWWQRDESPAKAADVTKRDRGKTNDDWGLLGTIKTQTTFAMPTRG